MATVTLPDGRELEVADNDPVLDYYRGEGATVTEHSDGPSLPATFDGEKYVSGVAPVDGDPVVESVEVTGLGAGEEMHGIEHPADGTMSPEISNDPADQPGKRDRR